MSIRGLTQCDQCPLKRYWGKMKVPVYENGRVIAKADYRAVGFMGSKTAPIIHVGESPGAKEVLDGKCFVGPTGKLIEAEYAKHKIQTDKFFFGNACRCHIPKKEVSRKEITAAMQCCRAAIGYYIRQLRPKLVVCFGDIAMQQVLKKTGITSKRGQFFRSEEYNCDVFVTYHPAYCLYDQSKFAFWRPDMETIAEFVKNGYEKRDVHADREYRDIDDCQFLLDKENYVLGVDTETEGKDWLNPNSVVIGICLSDDTGKGYFLRLIEEVGSHDKCDLTIKWMRKGKLTDVRVKILSGFQKKLRQVRELMRRPDIKKTMFHGNYELHYLGKLGIKRSDIVSYTLDVQLGLHCLDPDAHKQNSLADAILMLTPHRADHKHEFQSNVDMGDLLAADNAKVGQYGAADADATREAGLILRQRLLNDNGHKLARYYAKFLHPATTTVLYEIEKNGFKFDTDRLSMAMTQTVQFLNQKAQEALSYVPKKVLRAHAAKGLKLTRDDLLRDILFSKSGFGITPLAYTKGSTADNRRPVVDQKTLKRIRDEGAIDDGVREFLSAYLAWVPYSTLYSTFLKGISKLVRHDGRVHPQVSTVFTATGRTGMRQPNGQNIPKRNPEIARIIRSLIVAPPGKVLVAIDFSQSELRWIADWGNVKEFADVFKAGGDLHMKTGRAIAPLDWDSLSDAEKKNYRQQAKAVNFGYSYGMGALKFVTYARDEYNVRFSLEEAEAHRETYLFKEYPSIPRWHAREIAFARKYGYCRTPYGRLRMLPDINSDDFRARGEAERRAINTPIQGASSDSTLLAGLISRQENFIDDDSAKIILFVHDELVVEVDEDKHEDVARNLHSCFVHGVPDRLKIDFAYKMKVPLLADVSVGKNLAEMHELKFEDAV